MFEFKVTSNGHQYVADVSRFSRKMHGGFEPAINPHIKHNIRRGMHAVFLYEGAGLRGGRWAPLTNNPSTVNTKIRGVDVGGWRPGYRDWKRRVYSRRWKKKPRPWPPNAASDGTWVSFRGKGGKLYPRILSLTGALYNSLASGWSKGKKAERGSVWRTYSHGFEYGTKVRGKGGYDYPRALHIGTRKMAARPFLDWDMVGPGRHIWVPAIMMPIQRYLVAGFESLEKYGTVSRGKFIKEARIAQIEGRG